MRIKTDENHTTIKVEKINLALKKAKKIACNFLGCILVGTIVWKTGSVIKADELFASSFFYANNQLSFLIPRNQLDFYGAPIDETFIEKLPRDLKRLQLYFDCFIDNLANLPVACPDLEELIIDRCPNITNFDFIYGLKHLKSFKLKSETLGITRELIDYLDRNNIEHNLNYEMVEFDEAIQNIIDSIITEDMNDNEKLVAILRYVVTHLKYDYSIINDEEKAREYNKLLLSPALKGNGICINFAALTNALCFKANLTSYLVSSFDHAWNLVEIEGQFYFVDPTNLNETLIYLKNVSYLVNPLNVIDTGDEIDDLIYSFQVQFPIANIDDFRDFVTKPPEEILKLINEAQDKNNFIAKYGKKIYEFLFVILAFYTIKKISSTLKTINSEDINSNQQKK